MFFTENSVSSSDISSLLSKVLSINVLFLPDLIFQAFLILTFYIRIVFCPPEEANIVFCPLMEANNYMKVNQ